MGISTIEDKKAENAKLKTVQIQKDRIKMQEELKDTEKLGKSLDELGKVIGVDKK